MFYTLLLQTLKKGCLTSNCCLLLSFFLIIIIIPDEADSKCNKVLWLINYLLLKKLKILSTRASINKHIR